MKGERRYFFNVQNSKRLLPEVNHEFKKQTFLKTRWGRIRDKLERALNSEAGKRILNILWEMRLAVLERSLENVEMKALSDFNSFLDINELTCNW